jgi:hypothetical protein
MSQILADNNAVAPATPASGKTIIYPKTDKNWYKKDDAGLETLLGQAVPLATALVDGATPALDAGTLANVYTLSAAGDRTIAVPTNPTSGQKILIAHLASGGTRTLSLNTGAGGFRFGSDITTLTLTASGKTDYIGCVYNAAATFWDVVGYAKGF